jgi:hypothetical protein
MYLEVKKDGKKFKLPGVKEYFYNEELKKINIIFEEVSLTIKNVEEVKVFEEE